MTTNEFLEATTNCTFFKVSPANYISENVVRERVVCKDGFVISIQASEYHYCEPRISQGYLDNKLYFVEGWSQQGYIEKFIPYKSVELGFPSVAEEDILDYAEDPNEPTDTVYGYVPVEIVDKMLEKHGGIDIAATRKLDEQENAKTV